jgi:hypothetical protein
LKEVNRSCVMLRHAEIRRVKWKMDAEKLAFEQANKQQAAGLYIIQKILYNTSNCERTTRPSVSIQ